jgi:uncharacterized protein YutE (UPF0331/DUF86 family)
MVDPKTIQRRLAVLQDALSDLRRYRSRFDAATLAVDRDAQHMVLHALYIAAQATIDLALHAGADTELPTSPTYQHAFAHLSTAGRIDPDLAKRLMGWAGLRNVLAHQYATLDFGKIAHALHAQLGDLEEFASVAATWA